MTIRTNLTSIANYNMRRKCLRSWLEFSICLQNTSGTNLDIVFYKNTFRISI